ncbi:MAG TPA: 3-deoxy-D-manno-octulosonic acid transferase [Cytophagales bacterium]|nr:3-deoxy-D-manno-octulosonic acid transferase [Cytophagales bacterium]
MSKLLYNLSIQLLRLGFILASPFHSKAALFVSGRRNIFSKLHSAFLHRKDEKLVWVHCASLGEFEQGRPVIEALKEENKNIKILLTFFSPSGYEVRKDYPHADYVFYLPWDTPGNAARFVSIIQPSLAIFVKYEFWYNYTHQLKKSGAQIISISCILRPGQSFFKSYGGLFRSMLHNFDFFFTQNLETQKLLESIQIKNSKIAGDTRFDRVMQIIREGEKIADAEKFKNGQRLMVLGSCWPEDMEVMAPFINEHKNSLKFIIAPHEITESFMKDIEKSLRVKSTRYSLHDQSIEDFDVLIIDNIGMLAKLYHYGEFAFVGGGFGKGIHNILEAACYGIPIFFGNKNYEKYQEANELIMRGGAFEVGDYADLKTKYNSLIDRPENFSLACDVTRSYVEENLGATRKIVDYCNSQLRK